MWVSLGRTGVGGARLPGRPVTVVAILAAAICMAARRDGLAATFDEPDPTASVLLDASDAESMLGLPAEEQPSFASSGVEEGTAPADDASSIWNPAAFIGQCRDCDRRPADCDPLGLVQRLKGRHDASGACWALRADALILWRDAPGIRPLYALNAGGLAGPTVLDASQLESPAAGGGRVQALRQDACGNGLEAGYLYGGQFFSQKTLPLTDAGYLTAPPGMDGIDSPIPIKALDQAGGRLLGSIQSGEINRRVGLWPSVRFLYGFRWFQWYETSVIADTFTDPLTDVTGADVYSTSTINNLWGGQIGFDALILRTQRNFRIEGLVKAGAYANNARQSSRYVELDGIGDTVQQSQVSVSASPASCSFAGEVGLTGVVPICDNWDFRFGYLGLWLTGLAQPTNQLSGQNLSQDVATPTGTLNTAGTVIVQGVTLGVEGRW